MGAFDPRTLALREIANTLARDAAARGKAPPMGTARRAFAASATTSDGFPLAHVAILRPTDEVSK